MNKDFDVKRELWKAAHALEAKAFDAGDMAAVAEASNEKARLAASVSAAESKPKPELEMPPGFTPNKGVAGALAHIGLADVGVVDDGESR